MIVIITCGHHPEDERIYGREIQSLLKAGHKITYFTRWSGESYLSQDNLWHRNYSEQNLSIKDYISGILNDLKVLKPSVVHIHEFELLPIAKTSKKLYESTIIYDVHEANIELWDAFSSKPQGIKQIINKSLYLYEKRYLKYVDYVLTTTLELVERYENWGIKSYFLPNYPKIHLLDNKKNDIFTIIYSGQISHERGIEDLINAIPPLLKEGRDFKVEIYGTERKSGIIDHLSELIIQLKLEKYVNINKQVSHSKMMTYLSKAHISVIPFRDHPMFQIGIPVKMFEAMWAECTIVASEVKPILDHDEDFIEFYSPGDVEGLSGALKKLLKDKDERIRKSQIGLKLIEEKYNWEKVEPTLLKIYANFIE